MFSYLFNTATFITTSSLIRLTRFGLKPLTFSMFHPESSFKDVQT
jgi:hypothetical protein